MRQFTKKNKEKISFKFDCKNYGTQQKFLQKLWFFFPDKSSSFEKISLIQQDRAIIDNRAIAEVFNDYFSNYRCVKSVRIRSYSSLRIQSECGKMRIRITLNTVNFHSVIVPVLELKIPGT